MYDKDTMQELYSRLKAQYPRYEVECLDDCLILTRLYGKVEVYGEGVKLYVNGTLYDQFSSEEVDDSDDLYEMIELFLLDLQHAGMQEGNETYCTARKKAARLGSNFLILMSIIFTAGMIALIVSKNLWWWLFLWVVPAISLVPLALIQKRAFQMYWVCPTCGQPLPLDKKSRFPKMEYVPLCPQCGQVLEKAPELPPLYMENAEPKRQLEPDDHPPQKGKKWPCILTGSITVAMAVFLLVIALFSGEPLETESVGMVAVLIGILGGCGLALLLCRCQESEEMRQQIVVVREQKAVTGVGVIVWLIGMVVMFMTIAVAVAVPVDGTTIFLSLVGILVIFSGVWMILAGHNRALFVLRDNSILYISSWGRKREFVPGQVDSVRLTANRSIHLLNEEGKKLASVEANMRGISRFAEWIENTDLAAAQTPAMEKQTKREIEEESIVQWREEYRTRWHDHIKGVRIGMWVTLVLFALGTIVPIPLFLFMGTKFQGVMAIGLIAPIPFLLFCGVCAPVLLFGDRPKNATPEWNAMYVKVPLIPAMLLAVFYMGQVHFFWDGWLLQEADNGWRWVVRVLAVGIVMTLLLLLRTPKRMRLEAGVFMGMICFCVAVGLHYYFNAALSGPARHYPAVIVDSHAEDPDAEDDDYTLTVLLDNGEEATLAVLEEIYGKAMSGEDLDICHRESPFGVSLLSIHESKGK